MSIQFETDADRYQESFRYNLDSSMGVVPTGLSAGDRYTFTAVVPPDEVTPASVPSGQVGTAAAAAPFLDAPAAKWTEGVTDPTGRVFVNAPIMVGNDKQYAAVMALMANRVGVPARVVMGATLPEGGVVRGSDVAAWVELRVGDGSWRVLPTEAFMDTDRPANQQTQTEEQLSGLVIPPPAQVPPPSTIDEQTDAEITARKVQRPAK